MRDCVGTPEDDARPRCQTSQGTTQLQKIIFQPHCPRQLLHRIFAGPGILSILSRPRLENFLTLSVVYLLPDESLICVSLECTKLDSVLYLGSRIVLPLRLQRNRNGSCRPPHELTITWHPDSNGMTITAGHLYPGYCWC